MMQMETVEVLVRIPKEKYDYMMANPTRYNVCDDETLLYNYIKNGTPLSKGHGRLVDADAMEKILRESEYYQEKRGDFYGADVTSRVENFIEDTDTVIEADKEVENG